jgi:hypothetical protein
MYKIAPHMTHLSNWLNNDILILLENQCELLFRQDNWKCYFTRIFLSNFSSIFKDTVTQSTSHLMVQRTNAPSNVATLFYYYVMHNPWWSCRLCMPDCQSLFPNQLSFIIISWLVSVQFTFTIFLVNLKVQVVHQKGVRNARRKN